MNRLPIDSIGIPATPTVCSNCRCALEPQIPSIPFKLIVREVAYSHDAHLHFIYTVPPLKARVNVRGGSTGPLGCTLVDF